MNLWTQDLVLEAWNYASTLHSKQSVPGTELPYINHVGLVTMETMAALQAGRHVRDPNLAVLSALLHDAIEDTQATYDDITLRFGPTVADGVLALTKNRGLPSKSAQMRDSLARIKQQPHEVWMVKLADRITNLAQPPHYWTREKHWDQAKIDAYGDEARLILRELGVASPFLARRLDLKIRDYPTSGASFEI